MGGNLITMILIDNNQIIISNLFQSLNHTKNELDEDLLRHLVLNTYRMYRKKFSSYGDFVICNEGGSSWRRKYFPQYKANRKKKRKESDLNWDDIHNFMEKIRSEVAEIFPYKSIRVEGAEADDIIASLCKQNYHNEEIIIVSDDKDFQQLQVFPNVKQYSPLKKKFLECENPKTFLIDHIIRGDSSDGIPNILSDDDTFVNQDKRQKSVTKKKMESIQSSINQGSYENEYPNWERNKVLIDLNYIPVNIQEEIKTQFDKEPIGHRNKLLSYFIKFKLKNLMGCIEDF